MQIQPISGIEAAATLADLLPELARAETYPQWSDGTGEPRRGQRVTLYDAAGNILGADRDEHRSVLRVLLRVDGGDWDRPQTFSVAAESLSLTYPVVPSLLVALWDSSLAAAVPSAGALLEQRHQLEDPSEPPLAVADVARDFAASVAAGLMELPDWGVCDPKPAPARPVADVPVAGEAL
jgi:hypothetical protein